MSSCGGKCTGPKEVDPSVPKLEVATVDFLKVQNDDFIHYAFDGIELSKEDILHNIKIGKGLLQSKDHLVVSSKDSIINEIDQDENFSLNECQLEDQNYYTVIQKKLH